MAEVCAVHAHTKSRYGCASYYRVRRITLDQRLVQIAVPQCRHVSTARNGAKCQRAARTKTGYDATRTVQYEGGYGASATRADQYQEGSTATLSS
eukprot:998311-Rhodomonas_salina.1